MNEKDLAQAIVDVMSALIIERGDEEKLYAVLLSQHLKGNGGPHVDPSTLLLSMRDAFYELLLLKEDNKNLSFENVYTPIGLSRLEQENYIIKNPVTNRFNIY